MILKPLWVLLLLLPLGSIEVTSLPVMLKLECRSNLSLLPMPDFPNLSLRSVPTLLRLGGKLPTPYPDIFTALPLDSIFWDDVGGGGEAAAAAAAAAAARGGELEAVEGMAALEKILRVVLLSLCGGLVLTIIFTGGENQEVRPCTPCPLTSCAQRGLVRAFAK